ncbi:MAG TPA: hypothetical protein VI815_03450 [Candidatus Nanoarchaeia archaeon]|nr:hypothetical protein [Candidatus Nanoarchaeia archaeon]
MAKKKRGKRGNSTRSYRSKSSNIDRKSNIFELVSSKKTATKVFLWILFTAFIIYGIYHVIVIDTIEGFKIILGVIILGILIKILIWLFYKLKNRN